MNNIKHIIFAPNIPVAQEQGPPLVFNMEIQSYKDHIIHYCHFHVS